MLGNFLSLMSPLLLPPDTLPHPLRKAQEVWWLVRCSRTAAGNENLVDGNVLRAVGVCHLVYSRWPHRSRAQSVPSTALLS